MKGSSNDADELIASTAAALGSGRSTDHAIQGLIERGLPVQTARDVVALAFNRLASEGRLGYLEWLNAWPKAGGGLFVATLVFQLPLWFLAGLWASDFFLDGHHPFAVLALSSFVLCTPLFFAMTWCVFLLVRPRQAHTPPVTC